MNKNKIFLLTVFHNEFYAQEVFIEIDCLSFAIIN